MADKIEYTMTLDEKGFVQGVNNAEKALKGEGGGGIFGDLLKFETVKRVFDATIDYFKEAINLAAEASRTNAIWANSIQKAGLSLEEMDVWVKEVSRTNAIQEDEVKRIQNYGVAWGITGERLKIFTQATIDYSAASGRGIEMSMRNVATEAKKGGDALERFAHNIKGAGEDSANADGGLKKMQVALRELQETAGKPLLLGMSETLNKMNGVINETTDSSQKWGYVLYGIVSSLGIIVNLVIAVPRMIASIFDRLGERFEVMRLKIVNLQDSLVLLNPLRSNDDKQAAQNDKLYNEGKIQALEKDLQLKKEAAQLDIQSLTTQLSYEDYVKKINQGYKTRNILLEETDKQEQKIKEAQKQLDDGIKSIVSTLESNLTNQDDSAKKFGEMATQAYGVYEAVQKISDGLALAKLSSGDIIALLTLGIELIITITDSISKMNQKETEADKFVNQTNKDLAERQLLFNQINAQLDTLNAKLKLYDTQNQLTSQQTSDKLKGDLALQQQILQTQQDAATAEQKRIDAASQSTQSTKDALTQLRQHQAELDQQLKTAEQFGNSSGQTIDNIKKETQATAEQITKLEAELKLDEDADQALKDKQATDQNIADTEAAILALKQQIAVQDNQNLVAHDDLLIALNQEQEKYAKNPAIYQNNIISLIQEQIIALQQIADATDDQNTKLQIQTQIQQKQNDLLEARLQTQSDIEQKIKNQISLGLLDVQNIKDIGTINSLLYNSGLSGLDLASAASDLGIRSDQIGGTLAPIGQINITNYEANLNSLAGSITNAINGRLA